MQYFYHIILINFSKGIENIENPSSESIPTNLSLNEQKDADNIEQNNTKYRKMCIVTSWSQFRQGRGRFHFEFIDSKLCKYIIYASVKVFEEGDESDNEGEMVEEYVIKPVQHNDAALFSKLNAIKLKDPDVKLILKIIDNNGELFSKLSASFDTRLNFVSNVIDYIQGIDRFNSL